MFRNGIVPRIIIGLLIVALLAAGGVALYRFAWAQGYQTAVISAGQAAGGAAGQVAPYTGGPWGFAPLGYGLHFWTPHMGFPFFGIALFLLFLFLIGGLFRGFAHRRWSGAGGPAAFWEQEHRRWHEEHKEEK